MSYSVKIHPNVDKFLKKCDYDVSTRIKMKLSNLKIDPFRYVEHYEGDDFYKLRIGSYRALVDVDTGRKTVFVRVLGHRRNIYKR